MKIVGNILSLLFSIGILIDVCLLRIVSYYIFVLEMYRIGIVWA
jgi:hypothetical protein